MSRAKPVSPAKLSALQEIVAALPDASLLFGANKELLATNHAGRAARSELATSVEDPWGVADMSLDVLLHRVLSRAPPTVVVELHNPDGATVAEARAARIALSPRTAAVLVTICGRSPRADVEGARADLVARLLPGLAHEIRGPLTTMSGLAQILASLAALPHDVRQHIATIPNTVDRADELMRSAVSLVRPGRPETHLPSSVNEAVERAQRVLSYELRVRGTQVTTDLDLGLPLCEATPEMLLHLMLALLLSYLDSPTAARALKVSTVANEGRRISIELEAAIFQPRPKRIEEVKLLLARMGGKLAVSEAINVSRIVAELPALAIELLNTPRRRLLLAAHDLERLLAWEEELATPIRTVLLASSAPVALRVMGHHQIGGAILDLAIARRLERRFPIPTLVVANPGEEQEAAELAQRHQINWSPVDDATKTLVKLLA